MSEVIDFREVYSLQNLSGVTSEVLKDMVDGSLTGTDDLCNFSFTASGIWHQLPGILMQVTVIQGGGVMHEDSHRRSTTSMIQQVAVHPSHTNKV